MTVEHTLCILKPNAVKKNAIGAIYNRCENADFKIVAVKMLHLTKVQAEAFYSEHREKPFFKGLVEFMISGPIVVSVLERESAIQRYRELMGNPNPIDAMIGTLRADYADSFTENAVHGSNSLESAAREIAFFFSKGEVFPRSVI